MVLKAQKTRVVRRMPDMDGEHVELRVTKGTSPWLLTSDGDTTVVEVLHYHDMPLAGVVRQDGHAIVYQCVVGHLENLHLWHYAVVADDVVDELDNADAEELTERMGEISHLPGALALATDRLGVVSVRIVDPTVDVEGPIRALYDDFKATLDETQRHAEAQRRTAQLAYA
jgi:hypothetical protein